MSITSRQFEQLTEMGISLWQRRGQNNKNQTSQEPNIYQAIELSSLAKEHCFTDILLAMNISIGEVKVHQNGLDLGLFNWYFLADKSEISSMNISFNNNVLVTPSMASFSQHPELKKQLWHLLSTEIL